MRMNDKQKITEEIDELRNFLDVELHPAVSPDRWDIYSMLCDMVDELEAVVLALLKEQETATIKKAKEHVFGLYGGICPKCRNWIQSAYSFCGFCGQAVKWE